MPSKSAEIVVREDNLDDKPLTQKQKHSGQVMAFAVQWGMFMRRLKLLEHPYFSEHDVIA